MNYLGLLHSWIAWSMRTLLDEMRELQPIIWKQVVPDTAVTSKQPSHDTNEHTQYSEQSAIDTSQSYPEC